MKLTEHTLCGYILEEVLAYLIRNTGYRLLVDKQQDPDELDLRHNGLVVKGRGAVHQVDVLGELSWIPAFTYPLRLFVEAKFRKNPTSIDVVRNMVATLLDVNQNNLPQVVREQNAIPQLRPKYRYAGAIFSTSGFSRPAMDMALAHEVSLIDLSDEFDPLLRTIKAAAAGIVQHFGTPEIEDPQNVEFDEGSALPGGGSRRQFLQELRNSLRVELGTQPPGIDHFATNVERHLRDRLAGVNVAVLEIGELFVGMGRGPHMIVLKAESLDAFLNYAQQHPSHDVWISWSSRLKEGRTWIITPHQDHRAYRLSFRVPDAIGDWIFASDNVRRAAMNAKQAFFSDITIYRHEQNRDSLIRLRFNPNEIPRD
jgi:hypothetical protein